MLLRSAAEVLRSDNLHQALGAYTSSCLCSELFKVSKLHTGHFERLEHEFDMNMNVGIVPQNEFQENAVSNDTHFSE
jgi:hypothetical protein